MRKILLAAISCVAVSVNAYAKAVDVLGATEIAPAGQTFVSAVVGTKQVSVQIKTHIVDIGKASDPPPKEIDSNCTYGRIPCSPVDSLKISVDGDPVIVPRSAFVDLADLNRCHLEKSKQRMVLICTGGDAADSYGLEITFDATRVLQRKKFAGEFPEDFEKTIYVIKPEDPNL